MAIAVRCSSCQTSFRAPETLAGKRGRCPRCKSPLQVPAVASPAESLEPAGDLAGEKCASSALPATAARLPGSRVGVSQADVPEEGHRPVPTSSDGYQLVGTPAPGLVGSEPPLAEAPRRAAKPARPLVEPPAASPPVDRQRLAAEVLSAFRGKIKPVRVPFLYRAGVVLVSAVMLLLPVAYVALILLASWLVYLHAVHNTWLMSIPGGGRARAVAFLVYLAPLFAGAVMVVFMIKPLFARPEKQEKRRSLTRGGEPLLFAFVDKVCEAVGAPLPSRIDVDCQVNASAGFRRGMLSFLGHDLVLTIGLPLTAGLTATQFAGVLAHEFGHFTQGFGMRLTYVVRSINAWFARVVYERDEWDAWLVEWSEDVDLRLGLVVYLARFCVGLTRLILRGLMLLGCAVSGFLMREMEYDADRHEARLAGREAFETALRQIVLLDLASGRASADMGGFLARGCLPDNFPKLVLARLAEMPHEVRRRVEQKVAEASHGLFDTHPSIKARVASVRGEEAQGVFSFDGPAALLFTDFDRLCRNVTWDVYRDLFGVALQPSAMHPVEELLAAER